MTGRESLPPLSLFCYPALRVPTHAGDQHTWAGVEKADLLACGVPPESEGPEGTLWLDFHSLRHWYCTWAANCPGVSPKTLQAMARHSTATLTLDVYAKPLEQEITKAVEQMPDLRHTR